MLRATLKDKSYRASRVGALVGRYIRWFKNEFGATPDSIRDYESILARMSITLADKDPLEVTLDDLRDVIDVWWSTSSPRTRQKVTSVIRAFFEWAEDQSYLPINPATKLRRPRAPRREPRQLARNTDVRLVNAAPTVRDRLALMVLLDAGVRRSELGGIQVRDFDLARRELVVFGKGQKSRIVPLRGRIVLTAEEYLREELEFLGRAPDPDDFLLYPEKRTPTRRVYWADPKKRCAANTVHRWWYRMLEEAGLVSRGTRSGLNMHQARHTFAKDVRRAAKDIGAVQHLLGHSDPATTISLYGGYDQEDLERAMDAFARELRQRDEPD